MAELVVCAAATVATPAVLFACEQAQKATTEKLQEFHDNLDERINSGRSEATGESEQENMPAEERKAPEEETFSGTLQRWVKEADNLVLQRSKEITNLAIEILNPPKIDNSKTSRGSRGHAGIYVNQRPRKAPPSTPSTASTFSESSEDTDNPETAPYDVPQRGSKVSFQGGDGSPQVNYIFRPAPETPVASARPAAFW